MSHVYVTSDWHIGHSGITDKFRTQFPCDEAHDDYVLGRAREVVTKRDVLIVIGDATWTESGIRKIADTFFPCRLILVRGNHDTLPTSDYLRVFSEVYGAYAYKKYWLTHIPIHPQEILGRHNIHGHCHCGGPYETMRDANYFNAILEFNDYLPIRIERVGEIIKEREFGKRLNKPSTV